MATVYVLLQLVAWCVLSWFQFAAAQFDGWNEGRATHYGHNDGASIHIGSCMFGHIDGNQGTGWNIAALSDNAPDYAGSCGRCYEVACRPASLRDGYGQSLDRTYTCKGSETVVVRITDTCPCYYPSNAYSNQRWCCGDQYHMDLSYWAYEKLGSPGDGVMGIYYRQVECPDGSHTSSPCNHNAACSGGSSSSSSTTSSDDTDWDSSSSSSSSLSSSSGGWSGFGDFWTAFARRDGNIAFGRK